ncbi:cupin domain-containing protein [Hymenobacter jeollabukensis]|uniref:Cupin domain-containing protein n=1 Tax=Hymenobacter jeollabukensis TaxID=2025313 RepID=A0A5R8WK63_9BACT|nr:cupin domain-containing protein [Hymenobacter jeollabukensis]TLM88923.1 cupin domain-containing protein [Hymenobacter jeollabukensis]
MKRILENPLIGDVVHFVKLAHEPGGPDTVVEVTLKPGGGNDLHFHRTFDEHFECLEGEVSLQVGKQFIALRPGQQALAPRHVVHRFFNASQQPTRFRVVIRPGSPGFEHTLQIMYGLAADGQLTRGGRPRKLWQLGLIVELSDINLPGLPGLLQPLLRHAARRAMHDGRYERELRQRYCAD